MPDKAEKVTYDLGGEVTIEAIVGGQAVVITAGNDGTYTTSDDNEKTILAAAGYAAKRTKAKE